MADVDDDVLTELEATVEALGQYHARVMNGEQLDGVAGRRFYELLWELRRQADVLERDVVRELRWTHGMTWQRVAETFGALGSRQAAHRRWKELLEPTRRTQTGNTPRGGRPKASVQ